VKILMLTWLFHPHIGGVERHVLRVSEELVRTGHRVKILTLRYDRSLAGREHRDGIEIRRIGGSSRESVPLVRLLDGWLSSLSAGDLFTWADLIHFHDHTPFVRWYLPRLLLPGRKPALVTFHGFETEVPRPKAVLERRFLASVCRRTVCVGGFIEAWYGTPCHAVILGGVDEPDEGAGSREERAAYLGRVEPDVGVFICLDVLRFLRDRHGIDMPLDLIGTGSLIDGVRKRASAHGLRVDVHGQVEDPRPFLRRALFTFTSSYLSMLEAMAAGSLVVAAWTGGLKRDYLRSIEGEGGERIAVTGGEAGSLADRLAPLLRDPDALAEVRERALRFASRNSWQRLARTYAGLYAEAVGTAERDPDEGDR
jgi:glycosyltransferase involved in cell wall biosynthesis